MPDGDQRAYTAGRSYTCMTSDYFTVQYRLQLLRIILIPVPHKNESSVDHAETVCKQSESRLSDGG